MQDAVRAILMYFLLPAWLAVGLADWGCHRRSHIERNAGAAESLLHLLMFAEIGVPLLMAVFLEMTPTVFAVMLAALAVHEATAWWDVHYASTRRLITPLEQHMHAFLEVLPLCGLLLLAAAHWQAFAALFGVPSAPRHAPLSGLRLKAAPLPAWYVASLMAAVFLFAVLPYAEELWRGLRWRRAGHGPARGGRRQAAARPGTWPGA
ncbi:diguanylate cyclase [Cupriavidus sp. 30B13]|uniref:diguanylate cyclase n=1 Tax=Cupriavidus sp. 30B13 TaxID=3384241 RepID=UPI003B9124FB